MNQFGSSVILKIIQLIVCITTVIYKKLSDNRARMIFVRNQKTSNEWNLLQNIFWSQEGNDFSIFTYAGYTFIIAVCLLARLINREKRSTLLDKLFLRFGFIIFLLQGILVFYSAEHVQEDLKLNVLILGSLSFLMSALFFLEDCLTAKTTTKIQHQLIQTDEKPLKIISSIPIQQTENDILHTYV